MSKLIQYSADYCLIQLHQISLEFSHKICFENFSAKIRAGDRIGIIGRNGSGKSSLLKILKGELVPTGGSIQKVSELSMADVPQLLTLEIQDFKNNALKIENSSGGERFNLLLTRGLSIYPDVLLLDEPTNHLDHKNRQSLMRTLNAFEGAVVMVTHDLELLNSCVQTLWAIDHGKIHIFHGSYQDYRRELSTAHQAAQRDLLEIKKQKKDAHTALMKEQLRASKSRAKGEKSIQQKKWPTIVSQAKARRGEETFGSKRQAISEHRENLLERLQNLPRYEAITPHFFLNAKKISKQNLIQISGGSLSYGAHEILRDLNFSLACAERVGIMGENGSGKSTFLKGILNSQELIKQGNWSVLDAKDIGYLDQHYQILDPTMTVYESLESVCPTWTSGEIRKHFNDFLFRKNEEVQAKIETLSGGERARLCLALLAANTPELLVLDEITNNLDLETREHVIQVLKAYPSGMLVISHDEAFLKEIELDRVLFFDGGSFSKV
jgi:ATPase subunit of ABC transporter with duplicated ATPase domains